MFCEKGMASKVGFKPSIPVIEFTQYSIFFFKIFFKLTKPKYILILFLLNKFLYLLYWISSSNSTATQNNSEYIGAVSLSGSNEGNGQSYIFQTKNNIVY